MSPRYTITLILLIAAVLGSWYLTRSNIASDAEPGYNGSEHRGYYLKSARILGTGPDGGLLYEIDAARAEQQVDNRIQFEDVRIQYSPQSDVPWTIDADVATLYPDQQRLLLQGHVRAISERGFSDDETEIRTQYLEFDPENYIAETEERVQIRIGTRSITGTGMRASLNENKMEIKSNVSGRFIP
ncbi:MAG: LPS export ABC transporter periplasmic protein LptC [Gammaproteobacteria bacterium]|nr:LPS export ABC transporter periplasmic protein LptC [Gammaproteobacteria bacterium]